jgi:hypothetical protein
MKNLLPSVQAVLLTTPARWLKLADTVSIDLLSRSPIGKEWSALECLQHLIDTEQSVFPVRVKAFLEGKDFPNFDPDAQGRKPDLHQSAADMAAEFARLRTGSLELLSKVKASDLPRTARHSELGLVTLEEMLHQWAGHDLMHTVQAERALLQPFIAGTGPWRSYFKDHDVEAHG